MIRPSAVAFAHAFELREALEAYTAQKAADPAAAHYARAIMAAAEQSLQQAQAGRIDGFRSADRLFHETIAQAADNPRITKAIDEALALIGALRERDLPHADAAAECGRSHVEIAEAIQRHQPELAAQLMRAHLEQTRDYTVLHAESDGNGRHA